MPVFQRIKNGLRKKFNNGLKVISSSWSVEKLPNSKRRANCQFFEKQKICACLIHAFTEFTMQLPRDIELTIRLRDRDFCEVILGKK